MTDAVPPPSIPEQLCAAAFTILTDELPHSRQAQTWAARYLRRATRGGRTVFLRQVADRPRVEVH